MFEEGKTLDWSCVAQAATSKERLKHQVLQDPKLGVPLKGDIGLI